MGKVYPVTLIAAPNPIINRHRRGLSLFELLVVFAIASVLGGLAFYATTHLIHRTKHQRVIEEHRLIARALQNYSLDFGDIPNSVQGLEPLIRPTVYLANLPKDPFQRGENASYLYLVPNNREVSAVLISPGPDQKFHLPDELWEFAHFVNVDQSMIPPSVRARLAASQRGDQLGRAGASQAQQAGESTPNRPRMMNEAQTAMLMTYINLAQYHPDRGTEGDIITVTYH